MEYVFEVPSAPPAELIASLPVDSVETETENSHNNNDNATQLAIEEMVEMEGYQPNSTNMMNNINDTRASPQLLNTFSTDSGSNASVVSGMSRGRSSAVSSGPSSRSSGVSRISGISNISSISNGSPEHTPNTANASNIFTVSNVSDMAAIKRYQDIVYGNVVPPNSTVVKGDIKRNNTMPGIYEYNSEDQNNNNNNNNDSIYSNYNDYNNYYSHSIDNNHNNSKNGYHRRAKTATVSSFDNKNNNDRGVAVEQWLDEEKQRPLLLTATTTIEEENDIKDNNNSNEMYYIDSVRYQKYRDLNSKLIENIKNTGNLSIKKEERGKSLYWLIEQIKILSQSERIRIATIDYNNKNAEYLFDLIMCDKYFIDIKPNNQHFRWFLLRCWVDITQWISLYYLDLFTNIIDAKNNTNNTNSASNSPLFGAFSAKNSVTSKQEEECRKYDSASSHSSHNSTNFARVDSKSGLWLDILCMLNNDQIEKISQLMSKYDKYNRNLWDILHSFLLIHNIDESKNFYVLIRTLCEPNSSETSDTSGMSGVNDGSTIEQMIKNDLRKLISNYQSKKWKQLKLEWIDVICKYRLMNGVLTHIFNEFKYHCVIKNATNLSNWIVNDLKGSKHSGKALSLIVQFWENNTNKYDIFVQRFKRAMDPIFGARMDLWLVTTVFATNNNDNEMEKSSKSEKHSKYVEIARDSHNKEILNRRYFEIYNEMLEHTINLKTSQNKWMLALIRSMLC